MALPTLSPAAQASLYARFAERFSEQYLCEGTWEPKDDRDLVSFRDRGMALYPPSVRPGPRQQRALDQHPLFNLAYVAMRGDAILTTGWPMLVQWFQEEHAPLNERERLHLASMALTRLENEYVWYQEAQPHEVEERRRTAQQTLDVARDLGWDPRDTLRAYPKDWQTFRRAWSGFLLDHPIGHFFRGWEEERVLRKALASGEPAPAVARRRL